MKKLKADLLALLQLLEDKLNKFVIGKVASSLRRTPAPKKRRSRKSR